MLLEEAPGDVILGIEQDQRAHQRAASGGATPAAMPTPPTTDLERMHATRRAAPVVGLRALTSPRVAGREL